MQIILYSTHCPKCNVIKKKLEQKNILFEEINDIEIMTKKGFLQAPILEIDNIVMNFKDTSDWISKQ